MLLLDPVVKPLYSFPSKGHAVLASSALPPPPPTYPNTPNTPDTSKKKRTCHVALLPSYPVPCTLATGPWPLVLLLSRLKSDRHTGLSHQDPTEKPPPTPLPMYSTAATATN
ncbi:unnamed protein product [Merluccius merluccius]